MSTARGGPYSSTCPTCIDAQAEIARLNAALDKANALRDATNETKQRIKEAANDGDRVILRAICSVLFAVGLLLLTSGVLLFVLAESYKVYVGGAIRIVFVHHNSDNVWLFTGGLALLVLGSLGLNWTRVRAWAGL